MDHIILFQKKPVKCSFKMDSLYSCSVYAYTIAVPTRCEGVIAVEFLEKLEVNVLNNYCTKSKKSV